MSVALWSGLSVTAPWCAVGVPRRVTWRHTRPPHGRRRAPGRCAGAGWRRVRRSRPRPVSAVPRRLRLICAVAALALVAVMTVVAVLLRPSSNSVVAFRTADQVAMVGLGLRSGPGCCCSPAPGSTPTPRASGCGTWWDRHALPWSVVRAVRFDRKSPWASLLLSNGDELSVLAVQAADKGTRGRRRRGVARAARRRQPGRRDPASRPAALR